MALLTDKMMKALRDGAPIALLVEIDYPSGTVVPNTMFVASTANSFTFVNDTNGWVALGSGGTLVPGTSGMLWKQSGADPNITSPALNINGAVDFIVRIDLERTKNRTTGFFDGPLFYATTGGVAPHSFSGSYYKFPFPSDPLIGVRTVVYADMSALTAGGTDWVTNTITQLRLDMDQGDGDFLVHSIRIGHYVNVGVQSTTIHRFWTGVGTLSYNGFNWIGSGQLGAVSPVQRTSDMAIQEIKFSYAGVLPEQVADISADIRNRNGRVWLACFDSDGKVIADPYLLLNAELDYQSFETDENGVSTISITGRTGFYTLERSLDEAWSPDDQKLYYPLDTGLDMLPLLENLNLVWAP